MLEKTDGRLTRIWTFDPKVICQSAAMLLPGQSVCVLCIVYCTKPLAWSYFATIRSSENHLFWLTPVLRGAAGWREVRSRVEAYTIP